MSPDYLPLGSEAKPNQQLPAYLEIPMHDLANEAQMNFDVADPNTQIRLVAGSYTSQKVPEPFDPVDFVPYKLSSDKPALFPEFYHHFKKSFSNLSLEYRAYCSMDPSEIKAAYVGTEQDIEAAIIRVEHDFDFKFRQCLDPELLKNYESWIFTRRSVEKAFVAALDMESDHISYMFRMNELVNRPVPDVDSLFEFLIAFNHSDESIWNHVIFVYSGIFLPRERRKIINEAADTWKHENVPIKQQILGFSETLTPKGELNLTFVAILVAGITLFSLGLFAFGEYMESKERGERH